MAKTRTPDPTTLDADYYPRMKIHRRWYLIVPEMEPPSHSPHEGCAFYRADKENDHDFKHCRLMADAKDSRGDGLGTPEFKRHDCGDNGTIFVAPSKFPEYRAHLVVNKLEGNK
jgi:hypothetical protein